MNKLPKNSLFITTLLTFAILTTMTVMSQQEVFGVCDSISINCAIENTPIPPPPPISLPPPPQVDLPDLPSPPQVDLPDLPSPPQVDLPDLPSSPNEAWEDAKDTGSDAWEDAKDTGSDAWEDAKDTTSTAWEDTKDTGSDAWEDAKDTTSTAWEDTKDTGSDAWEDAKDTTSTAWEDTKDTGSDAWEDAKDTGSTAWEDTKDTGSDAWEDAKDTTSTAWEDTKPTVQDELGKQSNEILGYDSMQDFSSDAKDGDISEFRDSYLGKEVQKEIEFYKVFPFVIPYTKIPGSVVIYGNWLDLKNTKVEVTVSGFEVQKASLDSKLHTSSTYKATAEDIIRDWTRGALNIPQMKEEFQKTTGIKLNDLAYTVVTINTDFSALTKGTIAGKISGTLETCYNKMSTNQPDYEEVADLEGLLETGNEINQISDDPNKAINQEEICKTQVEF